MSDLFLECDDIRAYLKLFQVCTYYQGSSICVQNNCVFFLK